MTSKTTSQSSSKTREKTSSSKSSSSKESSLNKKSTNSTKLKPEQKESTKVKPKTDSLQKSVKKDVGSKNPVNVNKSLSSSHSNKTSKVSASSNMGTEKRTSSTSKSSSKRPSIESSEIKKRESSKNKEQPSNKTDILKSEKRKSHISKESHEKASERSKDASKSSSRNSSKKSSKDDTKSKKNEEKIKTKKHSQSKKSEEKAEKKKGEKSENKKDEKTEKKSEKSENKRNEKTEKKSDVKTEKKHAEKSEKKSTEKSAKKSDEKSEKKSIEKSAKKSDEKSEKKNIEKSEKKSAEKTEKKHDVNIEYKNDKETEEKTDENSEKIKEPEKINIIQEDSSTKEKGEIDKTEKLIVSEMDEENVKTAPEVNTNVNPNDNSLDTMESGISITSPIELSDGEVEESISSRFVEVDEMEYPSPPSSSVNLHSNSQPSSQNDMKQDITEDEEKGMEDNMYMDYEDDFENYESDFEDDGEDDDDGDDTEGGESDSNNTEDDDNDTEDKEGDDESDEDFDSNENDEGFKEEPDPQMLAVLKAIEAENSRPKTKASLQTSTEDMKNEDTEIDQENSTKSTRNRPKTSRAYVNFNRARERAKGDKASEKMKNRGQILLEMIQLDTISIDLFIQVSDSYESYIAAFGRTNTLQISTQTNDDSLSEEIQTDSLPLLNKWTQKPINISLKEDYLPTPEDFLGVGGDSVKEEDEEDNPSFRAISIDSGRLTKFLSAASQVVLMLLEEDSVFKFDSSESDDDENLGFSKNGIALGTGLTSLLEGRTANFVSFCYSDPLLVATGHGFQDPNNNTDLLTSKENKVITKSEEVDDEDNSETLREEPESQKEEILDRSFSKSGAFLCIWSVRQPSFPQRILSCHSSPKVACFSPGRPVALVAGLTDGSLAAWDFRESLAYHPVTVSFGDDKKWRLSPPSYLTACHKEGFYEGSEIVAIEAIGKSDEQNTNSGSFQVVSLSSTGQLTWWVIVQGEIQLMKVQDISSAGILTEHGAAPWSRITIARTSSLSIGDILQQGEDEFSGTSLCFDLKLSSSDSNQIYVAIANGRVLHCSRHNIKLHPPSFNPEIEPGTEALSISVCPHDPLYLLVGGNDGLIRLHSITSPSPLTCWQASNNLVPVRKIEWSPSRPCVFYMLDALGMFHIWDLSAGDIYPVVSVDAGGLIEGNLTDFNIATSTTDMNQPLHAIFASESGAVCIRSISSQFLKSSDEEYKNELERFKCYVSII